MEEGRTNPDTRPLPAGWDDHYDSQGRWYYVKLSSVPPQVTYIHPASSASPSTSSLSSENKDSEGTKLTPAQQLYANRTTLDYPASYHPSTTMSSFAKSSSTPALTSTSAPTTHKLLPSRPLTPSTRPRTSTPPASMGAGPSNHATPSPFSAAAIGSLLLPDVLAGDTWWSHSTRRSPSLGEVQSAPGPLQHKNMNQGQKRRPHQLPPLSISPLIQQHTHHRAAPTSKTVHTLPYHESPDLLSPLSTQLFTQTPSPVSPTTLWTVPRKVSMASLPSGALHPPPPGSYPSTNSVLLPEHPNVRRNKPRSQTLPLLRTTQDLNRTLTPELHQSTTKEGVEPRINVLKKFGEASKTAAKTALKKGKALFIHTEGKSPHLADGASGDTSRVKNNGSAKKLHSKSPQEQGRLSAGEEAPRAAMREQLKSNHQAADSVVATQWQQASHAHSFTSKQPHVNIPPQVPPAPHPKVQEQHDLTRQSRSDISQASPQQRLDENRQRGSIQNPTRVYHKHAVRDPENTKDGQYLTQTMLQRQQKTESNAVPQIQSTPPPETSSHQKQPLLSSRASNTTPQQQLADDGASVTQTQQPSLGGFQLSQMFPLPLQQTMRQQIPATGQMPSFHQPLQQTQTQTQMSDPVSPVLPDPPTLQQQQTQSEDIHDLLQAYRQQQAQSQQDIQSLFWMYQQQQQTLQAIQQQQGIIQAAYQLQQVTNQQQQDALNAVRDLIQGVYQQPRFE